jgi:hypothetical protein
MAHPQCCAWLKVREPGSRQFPGDAGRVFQQAVNSNRGWQGREPDGSLAGQSVALDRTDGSACRFERRTGAVVESSAVARCVHVVVATGQVGHG